MPQKEVEIKTITVNINLYIKDISVPEHTHTY